MNESNKQLKKEIRSKVKQLTGEYKENFNKIEKRLYIDVQPGAERTNALLDFLDMLLEASANGRAISELFPNGYETFYLELINVLPVYSTEIKLRKNNNRKIIYVAGLISCAFIIVFSVLYYLGYIGIWTQGISYHAGNLNRFNYASFIDENEYSIKINLNNLDSNIGIILYDDGECSIVVDSVDFVEWEYGGYRIYFRSHGSYNTNNAKLVSGVKHFVNENQYFSTIMTVKMKAIYMDKTYESDIMGVSGITYKDGDIFSLYIFANPPYDGNVSIPNVEEVVLTVTNLSHNIWSKKQGKSIYFLAKNHRKVQFANF